MAFTYLHITQHDGRIRSENFDFYQNQNGIAVKGPDKDKVLKLDLQELCGI